jgi:hypothetical protein
VSVACYGSPMSAARILDIRNDEPWWTPCEQQWVARWHAERAHLHCDGCGSCTPRWSRKRHLQRRILCSACYQRRYRALRRLGSIAVCSGCSSTFTPARSDARYCSPACRQRAYRERQTQPEE